MDMQFREEFRVDPSVIYLNAGTMSLTPNRVLQAVDREKLKYESNPAHGLLSAWERLWAVQQDLAKFLSASPNDLYLRTNVSYAMNDFIFALELPERSEILVSSLEYGAIVNMCRHKANLEGHSLRSLPIPVQEISEAKILHWFESAISSKTKLAVFSHIATNIGLLFPLEKMAEIAQRKGVIFAVDGAHGIGAVPLSFAQTKIDFYAGNLHKWMLGPKGTGFGWVSPKIKEKLKPKFAGWTSYDVPPLFQVFSDPWACRWMITSTHNFADFLAIPAALDFWRENSPGEIMAKQRELRDYLKERIRQRTQWQLAGDFPADLSGPMLAFSLPSAIEEKGFNFMFHLREQHGLQVSMVQLEGKWCMRFAPHIYNSESEIDRAAEILSGL